jgi:hypothetical protein
MKKSSPLWMLQQLLQRRLQNERRPSRKHIPGIFPVSLSSSRNRSSLAPGLSVAPTRDLLPPPSRVLLHLRPRTSASSLPHPRGPPASFSMRGRPPPPRSPASSFSTSGVGRQIQGRRTRRRGLPPSPSPAPARLLPHARPPAPASATAPAYASTTARASSPPDLGPAGACRRGRRCGARTAARTVVWTEGRGRRCEQRAAEPLPRRRVAEPASPSVVA